MGLFAEKTKVKKRVLKRSTQRKKRLLGRSLSPRKKAFLSTYRVRNKRGVTRVRQTRVLADPLRSVLDFLLLRSRVLLNSSYKRIRIPLHTLFLLTKGTQRKRFVVGATALVSILALGCSLFFWPQGAAGATYTWTQTIWSSQTSNATGHPAPANWTEYSTGASGVVTGSTLSLQSTNAPYTQTNDSDFGAGTHTDTALFGSGSSASVGLSSYSSPPKVAAGQSHACALKTDGTVYCWGQGVNGQLGESNSTSFIRQSPIQVADVGGSGYLTNVYQIVSGQSHTCALKKDGTVYCWGANASGQLGDNTTSTRYIPVQVKGVGGTGVLSGVSQIAAGFEHTCAVKTDGTMFCWGNSANGQLGDNFNAQRSVPVQVKGLNGVGLLSGVSSIAAGFRHTCAAKTDGSLYCWGQNSVGQLGDGSTTDHFAPVLVFNLGGLTNVSSVSTGQYHTCAVKTDGSAYCWGQGANGRLGLGDATQRLTPVQVVGIGGSGTLSNVSQIIAGYAHTCALKTDGSMYCWGYNVYGQLGDNTTSQRLTPVQVTGVGGSGTLSNVTWISNNESYTCALKNDGAVYCWGYNFYSQLGDGGTTHRSTPVQVLNVAVVSTVSNAASVGPGMSFSCFSKSDGTVYCGGVNVSGKIGDNVASGASTITRYAPVQVKGVGGVGVLTGITQVRSGESFACALKNDGTVYCWGLGSSGQLGENSTTTRYAPVQVKDVGGTGVLSGVTAIATGYMHACAIKTDAALYCWGANAFGQLGDSSATDRRVPIQVKDAAGTGTLSNVVSVSAGYLHTCAARNDGSMYCWGYNGFGQLGDNTVSNRSLPVQVKGIGGTGLLSGISSVASGYRFSCGASSSGSMYCWGENGSGQLGDGTVTQRSAPVQVLGVGGTGTLSNVSQITGGRSHTCALKTDSTLFCWGSNTSGQLGDNTTTLRLTPVQTKDTDGVSMLTGVTQVMDGDTHTCAVKSDGKGYCWGYNYYGQLGDNTVTQRNAPSQLKTFDVSGTISLGIRSSNLTGTFTSSTTDTSYVSNFTTVSYSTTLNGQTLTVDIGAGNTAVPDGSWSWINSVSSGANISALSGRRYVQYIAHLSTADQLLSPFLDDITINSSYYGNNQTLISSAFDSSSDANIMGNIAWNEDATLPTGTTVEVALRTASTQGGLSAASWSAFLNASSTGCSKSGTLVTCSGSGSPILSAYQSGLGNQWFQYQVRLGSDGHYTPTLSDIAVQYIVNAPPTVQNVTAAQGSNGLVTIGYDVKDVDTASGSVTPGFVTPSFQYWNGSSWVAIATLATGDTSHQSVDQTNFTSHTATWTATTDFSGQYMNGTAKVRVTVNDNEGANNTASADSSFFTLDTKAPTANSVVVDASVAPAALTLASSDDSSLQMKISLNSDLSGASWQPYATSSTIALATDPDTVYVQYKDAYGNVSSIVSATTPETPQHVIIQDVSNLTMSPAEYQMFLAWKTAVNPTPGFGHYAVYRSSTDSSYVSLASVGSRLTNYYADNTVGFDTTMYYKVATVDATGNVSYLSDSVHGKANGTQDSGEGGGGSEGIPPVISNVSVTSIDTTQAVVTWDTDELSSSTVGYSGTSGIFTSEIGNASFVDNASGAGRHSVVLTNLTPNTHYYFQVQSSDPSGNASTDNNGGSGYAFTTLSGPVISGVSVISVTDDQVTIDWNTTTSASSFIVYSTAVSGGALTSPTETGSSNLATTHNETLTGLSSGTTYYFSVKSTDGSGNIATDNNGGNFYEVSTTSDTTPPVLSSIVANFVTENRSVIEWVSDEAATSQVRYAKTSGGPYASTTATATYDRGHYVILTSLEANTTYYYRVVSVDLSGNQKVSSEQSFTTAQDAEYQHDPLSAISDISDPPVVLTDKKAVISFKTDQPAKCSIEYGTQSGSYREVPISETLYNREHALHLPGLIFETRYYYKVLCADNLSNAIESDEHSFTTLVKQVDSGSEGGDTAAPNISGVSVKDITGESAIVEWNTDEDANSSVSYGISSSDITLKKIAGDSAVNLDKDTYDTAHTVTLTGLVPDTKYYFQTVSADISGNITQSSEESFTTKSPSGISSIKTVSSKIGEVTLTWKTGTETSSIVEYGIEETYGQKKEDSTRSQDHSITLSSLENNVSYHFRVRGEDKDGNLYASSDYTFEPQSPPEISNVNVTVLSEYEAKIVFGTNVPTDALVNYANVSDSADSGSQGKPNLTQTHEVILKNLIPGATYEAVLKVRDEFGNETTEKPRRFTLNEDTHAPTIDQVKTDTALTQDSKVQAIISWSTDEASTTTLLYREGQQGEEKALSPNDDSLTDHVLVLTAFKPGSVYYFRVKSIDKSGNEAISKDYILLTPRRTQNVVEVIVNNFKDIFSWAKF